MVDSSAYLIVELGQKRTESKTAGSWDGINQVTAGSVKAADLKMILVSKLYRWWLMMWDLMTLEI